VQRIEVGLRGDGEVHVGLTDRQREDRPIAA
jgi:hypothetical protein